MKNSLLLIIGLLIFNQIKSQTDSLTLIRKVDSLKSTILSISRQQEAQKAEINTKLNTLKSTTISNYTEFAKNFEDQEKQKKELELLKLKERYLYGSKALAEMEKGVTLISFMQQVLQLQQEISNTTNIWSDSSIRNNYDKFGDFLTIMGPVVAGGMIATNNFNSSGEKVAVGSSVGLIAIGQLVKKLFGRETVKKFEFIDMTRKAYDNLVVLNEKLTQYISINSTLETRISEFRTKYDQNNLALSSGKLSFEDAKKDLIQVIGFIDEYNLVLSQIPQYIFELKGILLTYPFKYYKAEDYLSQTIKLINAKAVIIESNYIKKVRPLLEVTPEFKAQIYGI